MYLTIARIPITSSCLIYTILRSLSIRNQIQTQKISYTIADNIMPVRNIERTQTEYEETGYHIVDDTRHVIPYAHDYITYAKGRWLNRELIEVLSKEFGGHPKEYIVFHFIITIA